MSNLVSQDLKICGSHSRTRHLVQQPSDSRHWIGNSPDINAHNSVDAQMRDKSSHCSARSESNHDAIDAGELLLDLACAVHISLRSHRAGTTEGNDKRNSARVSDGLRRGVERGCRVPTGPDDSQRLRVHPERDFPARILARHHRAPAHSSIPNGLLPTQSSERDCFGGAPVVIRVVAPTAKADAGVLQLSAILVAATAQAGDVVTFDRQIFRPQSECPARNPPQVRRASANCPG